MDSIHIQTSKASSIAGSVAARLKGIASGKILFCFLIYLILLTGQKSFGQGVGISEVSITPDPSAILELRYSSGGYKGFLIPRMTTANRNLIASPATGLLIFNTSTNSFNYYNGSGWIDILNGNTGVTSVIGTAGQISVGGTSTAPIIGIDATYIGQTSITTLGTIGTGTWNGTTIDIGHGGTGSATQNFVDLSTAQNIGGVKTFTSTISGSISGNASTATKLSAGNTINGVNFDGSAAITVPVNSVDDIASSSSVYPLWTTAIGNTAAKLSTTKLSFVPSTGILTATGFAGSGAGLTNIPNSAFTNSSLTIGSTNIALGGTSTTLAGLTSVSSTSFTGALSGNATTATTLQTPRAINGVSFDGSTPITVTADAGTLTGTTLNASVVSSSLTSVGTLTNLSVTNPISGSVTGNAGTATKLSAGNTINGVNFDGSAAITVPVNSVDDIASSSSVYPLWTTAIGNTAAKLSTTKLSFVPSTGILTATGFAGSGAGLTNIPNSAFTNSSLTIGSTNIALGETSTSLAGLTSISSTSFTGALSGNATTATTLQTPRAINGVSFDGSAPITVTADAGTLTGTTLNASVVSSSLTSVGTLTNLSVTNPISGSVTGNAGTATKLSPGNTINGVTFDGSAAITVPVNSADDNASLASVYPLWTTAAGNLAAKLSTTKLSFIPNTGILTATGFAGSGAGLTNIPNSAFTNSSLTIGSTNIALGGTSTSLAGLTSISSTSFTGALSGNATTATTLQTPRAINGVSFDGSAPITVTADAGTLTGTTLNASVVSSSLTSVGTLTNLSVTNPISGSVTGNAGTATKLSPGNTINGVTFDGSAAITVPVNSADDNASLASVYPLWTTAAGNLAAKLSTTKLSFIPNTGILTATGFAGSGAGLTNIPNSAFTNSSLTIGSTNIALGGTSTTLAGLTSVSSTAFTGALSGNATTATTLQTPRAINGVSFDGSAPITVTADAGTLTGTTLNASVVSSSLTSIGTLTNLSVTNPISGSVTGNAGTATKLSAGNTINGVNFDGSAAITVPVNSVDDIASSSSVYPLWTTAIGNTAAKLSTTKLSFVPSTGILTATGFAGSGAGLTNIPNSAFTNSSLTIGSTNIALGGTSTSLAGLTSISSTSFTGALSGNATTATTLQTPRAINGVSFDGSTPITVTADAGTLTGTTLNASVVSSSLTSVGTLTNLSVTNPISGSVSGNAGTATKLSAGNTINGVNFDGSAAITVPVNSVDDIASSSSVYPLWTTAIGNTAAKLSTTKLSFVPSTGILTATGFAGSGAGLTNIPNSAFTNSSLTIGSTNIALGATSLTLAGLTSVSSNSFIGGIAGTSKGTIALSGNSSGTITIQPQAASGTYNFNLPITAGNDGDILVSHGGGSTAMTFEDQSTGFTGNTKNATITIGYVRYTCITGLADPDQVDVSGGTRSLVWRNGTIKHLYVIVNSAPGANQVLTIMKNGVPTSISVTLNGGTSGNDLTNSITVVPGDEIGVSIDTTGGGAAVKWSWAIEYTY